MRLTALVAAAAILTPPVLTAQPASTPGQAQSITEVTAAKKANKKAKKPAKKKEEYLKAAPGTGPSGPPSGGKSTY